MVLLWRSLEIVAAVLGLLVGLTPVMAASALAYGHAESNRTTSLSDPTGPYAVSRVSYHWGGNVDDLLVSGTATLLESRGRSEKPPIVDTDVRNTQMAALQRAGWTRFAGRSEYVIYLAPQL